MRLAIDSDALALFGDFCCGKVATLKFCAGVDGYGRGSIVADLIGS